MCRRDTKRKHITIKEEERMKTLVHFLITKHKNERRNKNEAGYMFEKN
jgi:hypothetical protein